MAKAKTLTIDYNTFKTEDYKIPANTKYNKIKIVNYDGYGVPFKYQGVSYTGYNVSISITGTNKRLILMDYIKKNGNYPIKSVEGLSVSLLDYINNNTQTGYLTGLYTKNKKGDVYTGSAFNDKIEATDKKEKIYGKGGNDEIYTNGGDDYVDAGVGNDIIYASTGNETLKGGSGENVINIDASQAFGNDFVELTKGENLKIKLNNNVSNNYQNVHIHYSGKNMVIDVYDKAITWKDEKESIIADNFDGTKLGSVTIKNYTKKDVMTSTGDLLLSGGNNDWVIKGNENVVYMDKDHYNKTSFTGTWVEDEVDASNFKLYKNGKKISTDSSKGTEITTETEGYEKVKGVTINLGDTPSWYEEPWEGDPYIEYGYNTAEGSIYADTIKGGSGNDWLSGGKGNDILTGGKGENRYIYYEGDGADKINVTKNEEMGLYFYVDNATTMNNLKMTYANSNKDLKIYSTDAQGTEIGSVTLKDFAKKDITKEAEAALYVADGDGDYDYVTTLDLKSDVFVETKATKNFTGTWMNDDIIATDYKAYKKVGKNKVEITTETAGYQTTKGLTLKGAGGMDNIMGSIYADTIDGGAGYDQIMGGKGNDKLTGGKDSDSFIFYKNDGVDTITDANNEDFIVIADDGIYASYNEGASDLRYAKNGNNLEIFYSDDYDQSNKIVVQNYYKQKDATKRVQSVFLTTTDMDTETNPAKSISLSTITTAIEGSGKFGGDANDNILLGSAKADTIKGLAGNDEIYGYAGNDNIYGGLGNDTINAGAGKNNIYYSLGDGDDTIVYGGGTDTLVFDSGITVTADYNGNDAVITYSGKKNNVDYSNTITIEDYKTNASVKYVKIGKTTKDISTYLDNGGGGGGDATTYQVNSEEHGYEEDSPLILSSGHNNKVEFSNTYNDCYITSNNTSAYTDTLQIADIKMSDGYNISNLAYMSNDTTLTLDTCWQVDEEQGGGMIFYTMNNSPKVTITDSERSYNFNGYTTVQGTEANKFELADGNNLVCIKAQTGTSYVQSNDDYNIIKTSYGENGAGLNYTYGGGHDVIATASSSNDTYNVAIGSDTSVVVYDADGADTINATGDNVRVIFDAGITTTFKTNGVFIDKTVLSNMTNDEFKGIFATTKGLNIAEMNINDGDTINVNGSAITFDNWSIDTNNVHQAVAGWLTDNNGYTSVADALENCTNDALLTSLKTCFVDGTYTTPTP